MIFERFEVKGLSHYSYLVGCSNNNEVVIVDPQRDVDILLNFARERGLKIVAVTETHCHADYASGAYELASRCGAALLLSAYDKGELYQVKYAHQELRDGDLIKVGSINLKALHTPGHTPEHLSFLVYNPDFSSDTPEMMLSGDFLFVGSVGRPDLLGEESKLGLAKSLYKSVKEKLRDLPGELKIYPCHGSGSMCGAGMGKTPSSTLAAERLVNPYLNPDLTEDQFIDKVLNDVPPLPSYYPKMKVINSEGAKFLETIPGTAALSLDEFVQELNLGAIAIDLRDAQSFAKGHIPGSLAIGSGASFVNWAAWSVPYDKKILLVCADAKSAEEAARSLVRVGLDQIAGYLDGGWDTWKNSGREILVLPQLTPLQLAQDLKDKKDIHVLDVRNDGEWNAGHIEGAQHIVGIDLADKLAQIEDPSKPIAVTCAGGYRSMVASSVLQRAGFTNVFNVDGGMNAWTAVGLSVSVN